MITRYVTNTYEIIDTYKEIILLSNDAKVKIEPSSDNKTKLVFDEKKRRPHEFSIKDGTLTIKPSKAKWYNFLGIGINRSELLLNIPNSVLEKISVKANVGQVDIRSINCKKAIGVKINTGKVLLNDCFAPEICVKTNTGSVSGKLPLNTVFTARTNTGKIEIPKPPIGEIVCGRCDIKTNTGNIRFE